MSNRGNGKDPRSYPADTSELVHKGHDSLTGNEFPNGDTVPMGNGNLIMGDPATEKPNGNALTNRGSPLPDLVGEAGNGRERGSELETYPKATYTDDAEGETYIGDDFQLGKEDPFYGERAGYDEDDEFEYEDVDVDEHSESEAGGDEENPRGKKRRRRKIRYAEERVCTLVNSNLFHTIVLHSLYVHRRLTVTQIHQMYAQGDHVDRIRSSVRKLLSYGLLERKRIFSLAKSLAETRTYHYNLSSQGIRIYALACMKLNMIHEDPDLPKQTFSHQDLAIRTQVEHHFVLQSFLAECIGRMWENKVYLPSSEWRRYLFLNRNNEAIYRPDWILYYPNAYFTELVETGRLGEDILNVPVLSRTDEDRAVLQEHYRAAISIECDMGTMQPKRLREKFDRILEEKSNIPRVIAMLIADNRLGEDVKRSGESKVRIRNIGITIGETLKHEVTSDEFLFLVGRQNTLTNAIIAYFSVQATRDFYPRVKGFIHHRLSVSKEITERDWKVRGMTTGLPDYSVFVASQERIYAFYFAYTGWLNPQVKSMHMIQNSVDDIIVVLVYPTVSDMQADGHLIHHKRLRYLVYQEWEQNGNIRFWRRTMDRSGERWEVEG